jgi:hypothetical protein
MSASKDALSTYPYLTKGCVRSAHPTVRLAQIAQPSVQVVKRINTWISSVSNVYLLVQ